MEEHQRRWEDLQMDCLVNVFERVGMESLLLDVPFVCKSWHKASLNPSCWQCLIFPGHQAVVFPWDEIESRDFQILVDRFATEYRIDSNSFSVTAFIKFVISRSCGNATVLKLPKGCAVEAFEFAANACPKLVTLSLPLSVLRSDQKNLEMIGNWENLEVLSLGACFNLGKLLASISLKCKNFHGLDLFKTFIMMPHALEIVKFVPNIKFLNLSGAQFDRDSFVTLLRGCKSLEVFDARDSVGFNEDDDEILKLASHIGKFMCGGSQLSPPYHDLPDSPQRINWAEHYFDDSFDDLFDDLC